MKRLFYILMAVCLLASCVKREDVENLQNQINEIKQENIASIESQIKAINSSITKLETTSVELKGFIEKLQQKQSELSDKDADLEKLIKALQDKDADLQSQISTLKTYVDNELKSTKDWVSATFATIEMYNNVSAILSDLQTKVSQLDSRLTNLATSFEKALSDALADVNAKIKELSDRLDACEENIESLLARIQSIVVLPTYLDGSVRVANAGKSEIRFEIMPRSASVALAKAPLNVFSLDAIATETKASVFTNIPITKVADNGEVLVVTVDASNLSEDFFTGTQSMSARLKIQDGNNSCISDFFALSPITSYYYIENGVNLGAAIAVLGDWNEDGSQTTLYWAPVNCGYEEKGTVNTDSDHRLGKLYQWGAGDSSLPYYYNGSLVVAREMYYDTATPSPWYNYDIIDGTTFDKWNNNQGPCPEGWRLPTSKEFEVLCAGKNGDYGWVSAGTYAGQSNTYPGAEFFGANSDKTAGKGVFFPAAGYRGGDDGIAFSIGSNGDFWSSTPHSTYSYYAYYLYFTSSLLGPQGSRNRASARSVRCVSGEGDNGSTEPSYEHAGTLEDPFTVADAIVYTSSLAADEQSAIDVYIKGVVTSVKEAFGSYGNVTLYIGDSVEATETFYVYRALGLGDKKCTDPDAVKVGDEVVVCGRVINYKGITPETVQNIAYLYSINGKTEPSDNPEENEKKGTGTERDPFNVAAAIAKCIETGTTATTESYYVRGTVSKVDETGAVKYGNITLDLVDDGSTAVFKAYRINSVGGAAFTSEGYVNVGDVVVVKGKLINYAGGTPETLENTGELISVNGQAPAAKPDISVKAETSINYDVLEVAVPFIVNNPVAGKKVSIADIHDGGFAVVTLGETSVAVVFKATNETENAKAVTFTLKYDGAEDVTCTVTQKVKPSGEIGAIVEFDATVDLGTITDYYYHGADTMTKDGVVISITDGCLGLGTDYRIYKGASITIAAPSGKNVISVEFTCTANGTSKQGPGNFVIADGEGSYSFEENGKVGTWTGSSSSVTLKTEANQVRATKIVVTLSK